MLSGHLEIVAGCNPCHTELSARHKWELLGGGFSPANIILHLRAPKAQHCGCEQGKLVSGSEQINVHSVNMRSFSKGNIMSSGHLTRF